MTTTVARYGTKVWRYTAGSESAAGDWVPYPMGAVVARPFNGGRNHHAGLEVRQSGMVGNVTVGVELFQWNTAADPPTRTLLDSDSYTNTLDNTGNPELVSLGDGRFVSVHRKSDNTIRGWVIDTGGGTLTIGSKQTLVGNSHSGNSAAVDADTLAISGNPSTGTTKYLWQSTVTGMTGSATSEVTATGITGNNGKYTPLFGVGGNMLWQQGDYTGDVFVLQLRTPAAVLLDDQPLGNNHVSEYTTQFAGSRGGVDAAGRAVVAESTDTSSRVVAYDTTGGVLTEAESVAVSPTGYVQTIAKLGTTGSRFAMLGYDDGTGHGFVAVVDTAAMTVEHITPPGGVTEPYDVMPINENAFLVIYDDEDAEYVYVWRPAPALLAATGTSLTLGGPTGTVPGGGLHRGWFAVLSPNGDLPKTVAFLGSFGCAEIEVWVQAHAVWAEDEDGVITPTEDQPLGEPTRFGGPGHYGLSDMEVSMETPKGVDFWRLRLEFTTADPRTPEATPLPDGTHVMLEGLYVPESGDSTIGESYLDGDQPDGLWEGVPHASTSLWVGSMKKTALEVPAVLWLDDDLPIT